MSFAKAHGLDVTRIYLDVGRAGSNMNRPGMRSMLEDMEAGRVGTIVVDDCSRLSRNIVDLTGFLNMARELGIKVAARDLAELGVKGLQIRSE